MAIQEMKNKGMHCRGRGLNCYNCKHKNECAEYVDCPELNQERIIKCPAIYKHFENKYYATMFMSHPKDLPIYNDDQVMTVYLTEDNRPVSIFRLGDIWYHCKDNYEGRMVIYKSLYDDHIPYAKSLEKFAGEVDKEKYPNTEQKYRFKLVNY